MNVFTKTLSSAGSVTINTSDGVMSLSVQASAGSSFTILGTQPFQGMEGNAVTLSNGGVITLSAFSPASPLTGITVTWVSGDVDLLIGF